MKSTLFGGAGADHPLLAILLLLSATLILSLQDSLIKLMSVQTSFWQIQTLRSIGNFSLLLLLARLSGGWSLLRPVNVRGVVLRAAFLTVCMFCFFAGAPHLSVAQMAAGLYTYPLFVCLLAKPVLGERIGLWRYGGVFVGAAGALLILKPWQDDFSLIQILPILAGFFFACNVLTLRRACRHETTLALALVAALMFTASGIAGITLLTLFPPQQALQEAMPFIAVGWPTLTLVIAGFALFASVLNLAGNICLTRAYQTADASLLAPLDYTYLIFAACWSKVIFDQWPDTRTLAGMLLILCAGSLIAWREQLSRSGTN